MQRGSRSPFGEILRAYRQKRGLSQAALGDLIALRNLDNLDSAVPGLISDKAISNLEAARRDASEFVRPRPQTVQILAAALDIPPNSPEEEAFLAAAEATRQRNRARVFSSPGQDQPFFVREGREEQLDQLEEAYAKVRAGTPRVILIAGDPGAGKTSLITEICRQACERDRSVTIGWGECTSGAMSVEPYLPFFQALNHLLGITAGGGGAVPISAGAKTRQRDAIDKLLTIAPVLIRTFVDEPGLVNHVQRLEPEDPHLQERLQRVLDAHNTTNTPGRFDQVVRFLTAVAASGPAILVLEDLHWASEQAYALLLHLQRHVRGRQDVPLLIIGSYRPSDLAHDVNPGRHPFESVINEIGGQIDRGIIDLSTAIGASRGKAFVGSLVHQFCFAQGDQQTISGFLFDRTEGHPLFAVELLRWLQDSGGLRKHPDGSWELIDVAIENEVPGKIRAVISERIERLPVHLRRLLEIASVQGNIVSSEVLGEVAGIDTPEMGPLLDDHLVKRYRLLCERGATTVNGKRTHLYQFAHALFQEYLYESLSTRERERLHAAIAYATIAMLGDAPHAASGEVAFHLAQAHQYGDAAEHAVHAGAVAYQQLHYDLALTWYRRAEEYARKADDTWRQCDARIGQGIAMRGTGQHDEAIKATKQLLDDTRDHGYRDLEAGAEHLLGQLYYDKSQFSTSAVHLEQAIAIYRELGKQAEASGTEAMLSHARFRLGAYDEALIHAREAWQRAREVGNDPFAAEALLAAGNCEADLGMYQKALETYRRARTTYHRCGEMRGKILCDLNTGLCHLQLGEWEAAIQVLTATLETTRSRRLPRLQAAVRFYRGLAHEGKGDLGEAEEDVRASLKLRQRLGQRAFAQDSIAALLRIAVARSEESMIRQSLRELERWLGEHGGDDLEDPLLAYLSMAMACHALGEEDGSMCAVRAGYELLMERASRISDDPARRSYITRVPANRRLVEWYEHGQQPER